jgi:hypothetical protein
MLPFQSFKQIRATRLQRFSVRYEKLKFSRVLKECVQCAGKFKENSARLGTPTFIVSYSPI